VQAPAEELDDVDIVEALGDLGELKKRMMKLHGKAIAQMDIDTWKKEPKARLPAGAIQVMRAWWEKHKGSPYPSVGSLSHGSFQSFLNDLRDAVDRRNVDRCFGYTPPSHNGEAHGMPNPSVRRIGGGHSPAPFEIKLVIV
jgi:hypothetical protein